MRTSRLAFPRMARIAAIFALPAACAPASDAPTADAPPLFESVQPELFATGGALTNAWADYDADGDPDLFVGFNGGGNRLYRNDAARSRRSRPSRASPTRDPRAPPPGATLTAMVTPT